MDKTEKDEGIIDRLPPEVLRSVGMALAAVMFWACVVGLVFGALIAVLAVL